MIKFYKYQGTGNDFVMIDNRDLSFQSKDNQLIAKLCDRRFGIGADGLILIQEHHEADFEMCYFNADGYLGSMCGNGARCSVAFAKFLQMIPNQCQFKAFDGLHQAKINDQHISVELKISSNIEKLSDNQYFVDTGSPHVVVWLALEDLNHQDVFLEGKKIRYSEKYKEKGTNVNFVANTEKGIFVRTYERGVEDETLSCGTGVTASALVKKFREPSFSNEIKVQTLGGNLEVKLSEQIFLSGTAEQVFEGIF